MKCLNQATLGYCANCKSHHYRKTDSVTLARAQLLAQEQERWTNEASVQGGIKRKAEQAQLRALDLAQRARADLLKLLNCYTDDTGSEGQKENQNPA